MANSFVGEAVAGTITRVGEPEAIPTSRTSPMTTRQMRCAVMLDVAAYVFAYGGIGLIVGTAVLLLIVSLFL
jgi:hypothetical protein